MPDATSAGTRPEAAVAAAPDRGQEGQLAWVDLGRAAAILAVIAIHVASPLVTRPSHATSFWFGNFVESASRWCVPMFVMISGYLLLSSPKTAHAGAFYRRRLARIGPPLVVWSVVYLVFGYLLDGVPGDLVQALKLVGYGRPYYHLYFLFLIAGLYVIAPGLRIAIQSAAPAKVLLAAVVALGLGMVDAALAGLAGIGTANAVTRFVPYVGYFLAGYALAQVAASRAQVRLAVVAIVAGVALCAVGTWLLIGIPELGLARGRYLYEYLSVTTVPVSLAVYVVLIASAPRLTRWTPTRAWRPVAALASVSFGVYLVHPIVLELLRAQGITARFTAAPVAFVLIASGVLAAAWLLTLVGKRLPLIRALV